MYFQRVARTVIVSFLPKSIKSAVKGLLQSISQKKEASRCLINKYLRKNAFLHIKKLHIGCGYIHLENFINVDYRPTPATDIALDCSNLRYFQENSFSLIYSNAFFEHIYRLQRAQCLKSCLRLLGSKGILLFIGIPDFYEIAKAYLGKEKGVFNKKFDTFEAYRLTHGDPEQAPDWWLEQLHKSLFDAETVEILLKEAGFSYYCIFNYCTFGFDIPVNLGMVGFKTSATQDINKQWLVSLLKPINKDVNLQTIQIRRIKK